MSTSQKLLRDHRSLQRAKRLVPLALAFAALSIGWSSTAAAAPYTVEICKGLHNATDALVAPKPISEISPEPIFVHGCSEDVSGAIAFGTPGVNGVLNGGGRQWGIRAPAGTRITSLEFDQAISGTQFSFQNYELLDKKGTKLDSFRDDREHPAFAHKVVAVQSPEVTWRFFCNSGMKSKTCPEGPLPGSITVEHSNIVATLDDEVAPTIAAPDVEADTVRGTTEILVSSSDAGSGVKEVSLFLDGVLLATKQDTNGGRCVPPYGFAEPCQLDLTTSFIVDTNGLAEGLHQIAATATDASGQVRGSLATGFTVHNAPVSTARPRVSGATEPGSQLVADPGAWEGNPTFSFQWLRCPAAARAGDEAGCVAIEGATAPQYAVTAADLGQRAAIRVTAKNAAGVESALSDPSEVIAPRALPPVPVPPDRTAPVLTKVSLSRKHISFAKGKKAGTSLRFITDEGGKLTIVLEQPRKKGKKPKHILSLAAIVKAGPSTVPLGAAIASKHLKPGRYRFTITVRDAAGNLSKPASVSFKVSR